MATRPDWNTPAHLSGLPCTNWKRRTGMEMRDTLAACIKRWLDLPAHQRRDCTLYVGESGKGRMLDGGAITREIEQIGLPPDMAAARGGQPSPADLARIAAVGRDEPPKGSGNATDAAVHCRGYKPG